jgi:hypothetical protein
MLQYLIAYSSMALLQATAGPKAAADLFEMRVRPVLAANCYSCHGEARLGGLRLDSRAELLKGGASGPAIIVGKSEESLRCVPWPHSSGACLQQALNRRQLLSGAGLRRRDLAGRSCRKDERASGP